MVSPIRRLMRNRRLVSIALSLFFALMVSLISSLPVLAHHGNAAFDTSKHVTIKGSVVDWLWANPHCVLTLDVKDDQGRVVRWAAEANIPSDMVKRGWKKTSFSPGDVVTVIVVPAKNDRPAGRIEQVVLANGETLTTSVPPNSPTESTPTK